MKRLLVLLIVLATLVCICACQKKPVENTTIPTEIEPTQPTEPALTVDPRIAEIQELFAYKDKYDLYNFALTFEFETPADIDLNTLFAQGFKDEDKNPTQQEMDIMGSWVMEDRNDLRRLPVEKIDAALTEVFGITLDQTNHVGMDSWWYLEETGCYYAYKYSGATATISIQRLVDQNDGTIKVYYRRGKGDYQDMIVTLKPVGDSYQIVSNVYESPMIGEMQALLEPYKDKSSYNDALVSTYETPADVDLYYLFYNGFKDESQEPTEQEMELLEGKMSYNWKMMALIRLPVEKMDAVLTKLFGLTLEETNGVGLSNFVYLEETDCYYHTVTGMSYTDVNVVYVEKDFDGTIMVQYSAGYQGNRMAKLVKTEDGSYRILSNVAIDHLYNETGVYNAVYNYFEQREAYLKETSSEISSIVSPILTDEASHLAAIHSSGAQLLSSEVDIQINGCWDSHSEAVVTETVTYRIDGAEQSEVVSHIIHLWLSDEGTIIVSSDGYKEEITRFTSASYVAE